MKSYDILVIGSGPGGEKAAVQGAKFGKRVAVIERSPYIGGAGIHTGTLPSKTLRETAIFLAGLKERAVFASRFSLGSDVTLAELMTKKDDVARRQMMVVTDHFTRNNIDVICGEASFKDANTLLVEDLRDNINEYTAEVIVIATGTSPAHPTGVPFDHSRIFDSDTILGLDSIPETLTIIGGGVIGCEYACIFSCLGVRVTLVEKRPEILSFVDSEIVESLKYWMRLSGVTLSLAEVVEEISVEGSGVQTILKSGDVVSSEKLLYTMGRVGNTAELKIDALGIKTDKRGLITVDDAFRTLHPHIYAVGDVIGFPSLAATSREQGRRAVCNAYEKEGVTCEVATALPYGIYTIPEISMVGRTEKELKDEGVPYESGTALFSEVARGQISGETYGMLKLLFNRETRALLGVHMICDGASELIHIGQAVLGFGGTIDYFKDAVFNYPTLTDAYKQAAHNGLNKLQPNP